MGLWEIPEGVNKKYTNIIQQEQARMNEQQRAMTADFATAMESEYGSVINIPIRALLDGMYQPAKTISGGDTLVLVKKSIKQINADAVSEEMQGHVRSKIERLKNLGATAQAVILETELQVRIKLARIQEWDYKVLPYEAITQYDRKIEKGFICVVHIDPLEKYCGTKNAIMPDAVLDELEKAKDRQIFDAFSVLWVEKVKDPLLLGQIKGCQDFFVVTEWGNDVSFDEIMKGK